MVIIKKISIIGDGGWGTTLAILLSKKGFNVTIWGAFSDYVAVLKSKRENEKFLPGVKIPDSVKFTSSMSEALSGKKLVILAVPSQFARGVLTILLGMGFDNKDGHVRVTKGKNFALLGGSEETHVEMQEKAIKLNEHLDKRRKTLVY